MTVAGDGARIRFKLTLLGFIQGIPKRSGRWDVDHRIYLDPSIIIGDELIEQDDEDDEDEEIVERTSKPKSIWLGGEFSSDSGKRALKEFLPGDSFDFPKSVGLIRQCLQLGLDKDGIALDFFAGLGPWASSDGAE